KTIERAASKQVTEFLSKNNLLDPNQSGFKSGHSTEKALLSVMEALKTAIAAGQSPALVLLDLSAVCDSQPPHSSVHTVKYGHFWQCALLVCILPHWVVVQRVMARSAVCTSPPHHWGAPRLGDGTTSLCHL